MVDTQEDDAASLRKQLGLAAADLLAEVLTPTDVLGLAWARTVSSMATQLRRLPTIPVVQLTGALSRSSGSSSSVDDSSIDVVREAARVSGGRHICSLRRSSYPMRLPRSHFVSSQTWRAPSASFLRNQGSRRHRALGAGAINPVRRVDGLRTPSAASAGVCADIGGVFLAEDGTPLQTELNDRMVGISASQLKAFPR